MYAYVIAGPRELRADQRRMVLHAIAHVAPGIFISGAQRGTDVLAGQAAMDAFPNQAHHVWLPAKRYDVAAVRVMEERQARLVRAGGSLRIYQCLPGTDYPYRNLCMLQQLYGLAQLRYRAAVLAFTAGPAASLPRSGTWLCIRQAQRAGLPVREIPLY